MRFLEIVDVQVEMDLLLHPVGPLGGHMVWRELYADPPLPIDNHAVPVIVRYHRATQQPRPEGALRGHVRGVEYDDLSIDLHALFLRTTQDYNVPGLGSPVTDQRVVRSWEPRSKGHQVVGFGKPDSENVYLRARSTPPA